MNKIIDWAKGNPLLFIAIVIGIIILLYLLFGKKSGMKAGNDLATCLNNKGAKMYGAYYCGYCKQEKQLLGNSPNIPYTECVGKDGKTSEECSKLNITKFPTWIFADGKRIDGFAPLDTLKQYSGC